MFAKTARIWLRALAQPFTYLGLALAVFVVGMLFVLVNQEEKAAHQAALVKNDANARVFEEYISRTISGVDDTLLLLRRMVGHDPIGFDLDAWTAAFAGDKKVQVHFAITGADGLIKASTVSPRGVDLSQTDSFREASAATDDRLIIGKTRRLQRSGKWVMVFSRRLSAPDGSFAGLISAMLDPHQLEQFYRSINLASDGIVSLVGFDGFIRARGNAGGLTQPEAFEKPISGAQVFRRYRDEPTGSYWNTPGTVDPVYRLITYRVLADYPLIAIVGRSERDILQSANQNVRLYYGIAIFMALGIAVSVAASATRQFKILRAARKLELTNRRFDAALENMAHGLCMFDSQGRITVVNRHYLEMYRLSPLVVRPGCSLRDLMYHRKDVGILAGDPEEHCRRILQNASGTQEMNWRIEQDDGRVISVFDRPIPEGGWITVHRDVTKEVRAEADLNETRNFLNTIIEQVPAAIIVKSATDFRYVHVNKAGEEFLGIPAEGLIGKTAHDVFPVVQADALTAQDNVLLKVGRQRMDDVTPIHKEGGEGHVAIDRVCINGSDGKAKYILGVITDITERKRSEAQIYHMAHHDALTGLANRVLFLKSVDEALVQMRRRGIRCNIFVLDLDQFKAVNDTLGHPIGDMLLREAAARLRKCTGASDIVARLGGDEFAILQRAPSGSAETEIELATRLLEAMREPYDIAGHRLVVGTSIGIALAPRDGDNADQLLKNADLALYRAKAEGRNRSRLFDPQMEADVKSRHALEAELRDGIRNEEFELHYQTLVGAATREVCGVEALVRWRHPKRGLLAPNHFIELAEETGLIVPLGEWILRRACRDAVTMPPHVKVAVNLSATQFTNAGLGAMVSDALEQAGLPPQRLELEITETVLLHHDETNLAMLHALRAMGIGIVLDDFGTGYSSLSYLQMFPFDKIKIDRSFVSDLSSRADSAAIVAAVNGLGKNLSILTTAEGVETEEQYRLLRASGVDQMQGFLFSRPCALNALNFAPPATKAGEGRAA